LLQRNRLAPAPAAAAVERQIRDDPHQPRAEPIRLLKLVEVLEGLDEGVLNQFHRVVRIAKEPQCHRRTLTLVLLSQLAEGRAVALFGGQDQAQLSGSLGRYFLGGLSLRI